MHTTTYLIIGGTGGIGNAIIQQLLSTKSTHSNGARVQIFATYHQRAPVRNIAIDNVQWIAMDISCEDSIKAAVDDISTRSRHIDWVINCVGLLHNDSHQPEKALRHIETGFFLKNMQINALASLLLAKHLKPLLAKAQRTADKPAIFATISARVGSITDNQLGGWYSYRMSKAALNMGMKNLSIEWGRSLKDTCVVVMQPGTVDTELSAPFQGNVTEDKLFSPAYSAQKLLGVLANMQAADSGSFVDWAGEAIPW